MNLQAKRDEARALIGRFGSLTSEDVLAACEPPEVASRIAFSDEPDEPDGDLFPRCCGARVYIEVGVCSGRARCNTCGAEIVDVLAGFHSPLLGAGNGWVSMPSDALIERVKSARGTWFVVSLGNRKGKDS